MQKTINFLLDMLLVVGAIASIVTIDGGRWIISNPALYQPGLEEWNYTSPVIPDYDNVELPVLVSKPQADLGCATAALAQSFHWDEIYLTLDSFWNAVNEPEEPVGLAVACK